MTAHLPSLRQTWRHRDEPAAAIVVGLCDEIEQLRIALDKAQRAAQIAQDAEQRLRDQKFHARRILAAVLDPGRYVVEVDRAEAERRGVRDL
ncbi:MAG: hypothetical protein ACO1ON_12995 [Nocardioides sp.]